MTEATKMQPPNMTSQPPGPKPGNPTPNMGGSQNRWTARNARVRHGLTKDYEGSRQHVSGLGIEGFGFRAQYRLLLTGTLRKTLIFLKLPVE